MLHCLLHLFQHALHLSRLLPSQQPTLVTNVYLSFLLPICLACRAWATRYSTTVCEPPPCITMSSIQMTCCPRLLLKS